MARDYKPKRKKAGGFSGWLGLACGLGLGLAAACVVYLKDRRLDIPYAAAVKQQDEEQVATRFAKDHLKAFVERVERLEEEKKALSDDIRDVYAEAECNGFDVKALRVVVRLRKQDINERKEQEAILETYLHALGML